MPTTVNGIGTHYYGNKNRNSRAANCRSCGHFGELQSYDTRLWFVVFFIPVIPLGRKRIIDSCPRCRRHYVAQADEYAIGSQLGVSEAREKYRARPSPETALAAHAQMLSMHQHTEADTLRAQALQDFPNDASIRAGFANHLDQMMRYGEAKPLYEEAFKMEPDLPEARIGMAFIQMNANELDKARELLDFMETPGAGQLYAPGPLETLAKLYQKQGRHEEALEIFRHLLDEFPNAAQMHTVREMVRKSEKKVRPAESILPKREVSFLNLFNPSSTDFSKGQKTAAFATLVAILLAIAVVVHVDYVRRHRTLHIFSGLEAPVTVQIDDQPPIQVGAESKVTVAEGPHHVTLSGPLKAQYDIDLSARYLDRLFKSPVWILNLGGTANVVQAQYYYAKNPQPASFTLLAGKPFVALADVDYAFKDPPNKLEVSEHQTSVTKSGVVVAPSVEPAFIAMELTDNDAALTFLESHISANPENTTLFELYKILAQKGHQEKRAEDFLKQGLEQRPIVVNWHRAYQDLLEEQGRANELTSMYDEAIRAEPSEGLLAYLRSRLEVDPVKGAALIEQAKQNAPKSYWPWFSSAYMAMSRGDFETAAKDYSLAAERGLDPHTLRHVAHPAILAQGGAMAIVAESRKALEAKPLDGPSLLLMIDALIYNGQPSAARDEFNKWQQQNLSAIQNSDSAADVAALRCEMLYELGDFAELGQELANNAAPAVQHIRNNYLLVSGKPGQLTEIATRLQDSNDAWGALCLSIAYDLGGNKTAGKIWREKASKLLLGQGLREQEAGKMLSGSQPPDFATVQFLPLDVGQKLLLMCALVQRFPELRDRVAPFAQKLNVSHAPPYQLVHKVFPPPY